MDLRMAHPFYTIGHGTRSIDEFVNLLGSVEVTLLNTDTKTHYAFLQEKGNYDIARAAWIADYKDPETFLGISRKASGNNYSDFDNAKFEVLMNKAAADAAALVDALQTHPTNLQVALAQFESARLQFGSAVVRRARHLGSYMQAQIATPEERALAERHRTPEAVMAETATAIFL